MKALPLFSRQVRPLPGSTGERLVGRVRTSTNDPPGAHDLSSRAPQLLLHSQGVTQAISLDRAMQQRRPPDQPSFSVRNWGTCGTAM